MKPTETEYDFAGWRARMGWTPKQVEEAFGCSRSHYWKMEKTGIGPRIAAWAAYGLEQYKLQNQQ